MAKRSRRSKGARINRATLAIGIGVFLVLCVALVLSLPLTREWREGREESRVARIEKLPPVVTPPGIRVAIVIDDMGRDRESLESLLDLEAPVTIAVLPYLAHSRDVAELARAGGSEVLLHLPMEPLDMARNDPGKGALLTEMSEGEVAAQVGRNLDALPAVDGVNNHMGSKFTGDERLMRVALEVIKGRGDLFFLDSWTSPDSKAYEIAREVGLKTTKRGIFLDNRQDHAYIRGKVEELIDRAKRDGAAVAIGHPHDETISVLREMVPVIRSEGVGIVPLSELVE